MALWDKGEVQRKQSIVAGGGIKVEWRIAEKLLSILREPLKLRNEDITSAWLTFTSMRLKCVRGSFFIDLDALWCSC